MQERIKDNFDAITIQQAKIIVDACHVNDQTNPDGTKTAIKTVRLIFRREAALQMLSNETWGEGNGFVGQLRHDNHSEIRQKLDRKACEKNYVDAAYEEAKYYSECIATSTESVYEEVRAVAVETIETAIEQGGDFYKLFQLVNQEFNKPMSPNKTDAN